MKKTLVVIAISLGITPSWAQRAYSCLGADGVTHYQWSPCGGTDTTISQGTQKQVTGSRILCTVDDDLKRKLVGKTAADVERVCDVPDTKNVYANGTVEQWVYGNLGPGKTSYIYLKNGIVESWNSVGGH